MRDFLIDLLKRLLREFMRRRNVFLKFTYVLLRAFDLSGRQSPKDSVHRFDFGHTMANITIRFRPRSPGESCRPNDNPSELHPYRDRRHDQTIETQFVAQQLCNDSARNGGRRWFRLEARIPAVADHHAVNVVYELAKHGQLILIKLFPSAIYSRAIGNVHRKLQRSNRENVYRSWRPPAPALLH